MSMDLEFLERVRTADAVTLAGMLADERDVQALRGHMDAIEERIGIIRQALYRAVVAP